MDDLGSAVKAALKEAMRERGHVNVLIAGRTGVGKSTLVNAVFQGQYAQTGQGRPVTQNTREITKEGVPLTIFDTRGLEMAEFADTVGELKDLIRARSRESDQNKHIHVAWICIQEPGRRVEQAEIDLHQVLADQVPVIGVVTKAMEDKGFRAEVQHLLPNSRNVVRVRAIQSELDGGIVIPPMGLEDLVHLTMECVPEGHRRAFASAQKASIKLKAMKSHAVVAGATSAAALAGASPIPFSDAAILVPIQVGMIAGISATFGLELSTGFLSTLVTSAAGATAASFGGRALVSNILKLFPGAGTVVGGAISATTAAALTAALGEAYIATLAALYHETDGEPPTPDAVTKAWKQQLTGFGK